MKHFIYGLGAFILAAIIVITVVTINNKMTREKEMETSLTSAVEQTVDTLMKTKIYDINTREQFVADVLQNLLVTYESSSEIKIDIMSADVEKGLLGIRVTEYYQTPIKKSSSITCDKIVIFDAAQVPIYIVTYTDENGMTAGKYEIEENTQLPCLAKDTKWWLYNSEDKNELNQYSKSEIEDMLVTKDNAQTLTEPESDNVIHFYIDKDTIN